MQTRIYYLVDKRIQSFDLLTYWSYHYSLIIRTAFTALAHVRLFLILCYRFAPHHLSYTTLSLTIITPLQTTKTLALPYSNLS